MSVDLFSCCEFHVQLGKLSCKQIVRMRNYRPVGVLILSFLRAQNRKIIHVQTFYVLRSTPSKKFVVFARKDNAKATGNCTKKKTSKAFFLLSIYNGD